ncbi:hypothetical protein CHU32_22725 [Superficieibacter electus]|uniref:DUF2502 domain-containing protein n=1 Tax=Superficieibacter electus TaxID=2022662 RepID=A0A2P5GJB7_9ENTR|nr:DUF2502 domain-containing protein [Superficieibacter electus]POP41372.1 hypothetical protein CHU33_23085 [Superficieibacter electus]POP43730.1 hypothetical protein CHU32_22725 [Superficieibacter electus]
MSRLKPVLLALSMLLVAPMAVHAAEITLIPAVTLQIGDRDNHGNYWDGDRWRDHGWWEKHYDWRENRWQPHGPHAGPHHDNRPDDRRDDYRPGPDDRHR